MKWITWLLVIGMLLCGSVAMAANAIDPSGYTRIDTFGSDVVIDVHRVIVDKMYITAYTTAKTVTFINQSGVNALVFECPAGETVVIEGWVFPEGATFDDSASDLAAGDFIFIQAK